MTMRMRAEYKSFDFDDVCLEPGEQIGLHQQDTWELSYVLTGAGERMIGDTTESFASGDLVLVPPGIPHCWYFNPEVTEGNGQISNLSLFFHPDLLERLQYAFPELSTSLAFFRSRTDAVTFTGESARGIVDLMTKMRGHPAAGQVPVFMQLLLTLSSAQEQKVVGHMQMLSKEERRLSRIRTWVICNADKEVSLDAIASHVGMNKSAFCTFFKRATGKTFIAYLNEYRISLVCDLLKKGGMPVSEACYRAGFSDIPYFNRVFKRLKGCSPSAYVSGGFQ